MYCIALPYLNSKGKIIGGGNPSNNFSPSPPIPYIHHTFYFYFSTFLSLPYLPCPYCSFLILFLSFPPDLPIPYFSPSLPLHFPPNISPFPIPSFCRYPSNFTFFLLSLTFSIFLPLLLGLRILPHPHPQN